MSEFDILPPVPNVQLQEPHLTVPGYQPPSLGPLPPLSLGGAGASGATPGPAGIGSPTSMIDLYGHMTDPPSGPVSEPPPPNYFAPIPGPTRPELQLNGMGPISGAVNPWLANPTAVAEDAQRQINTLPPIDPGLAKQQTIIHAPTITF